MESVQYFSLGLLILRIIALVFFILLLRKQWRYLKNSKDEIQTTRWMLFILGCILLAANFVPIIIDIAALIGVYGRSNLHPLALTYAFSNASFSAITGFTFWLMYIFIERENIRLDKENKQLHRKHDKK